MVAQVLKEFANIPDSVDLSSGPKRKELLREVTQLGTRQAVPMSDYAFGAGLLDDRYHLTPFGLKVIRRDPLLETPATQWLIHYHLSALHGPGHLFWHKLVARFFRIEDELTANEVSSELAAIMLELKGEEVAATTIEKSKTAFLSTYQNADGLDKLDILESNDGRYLVQEPDPPSPWVFGLALLDYWRAGRHLSDRRRPHQSLPGALARRGLRRGLPPCPALSGRVAPDRPRAAAGEALCPRRRP